ncbi:amidohydrolase family protein [Microbacterium sp. 179-I 3D3 NHS]|uniref:amidohydrolase family protein n=1 Tax=Microbacterium sp. 179-I 3D3 NHS TaxID=3142382 RepID=UPI0039A0A949
MSETRKTPRIDAVCNLYTPEVVSSRPSWSTSFLGGKIGAGEGTLGGLSVEQHIDMMDEAGVDRAFLIAPKMGRVGLPTSWRLDPAAVIDAVQKYPDRFSGLAGIDPTEGVRGTRELEMLVKEYGFIGAHIYPHWFELAPDHRRYYPFYAKAIELDIPVQMQVGHCLRYSDEAPLPSVGRPMTLDTIACELPEAKLVGIHVGWPWTEEMIAVAYKHPNVYIGTDAYAPKHLDPKLIHYINTFGREKVLFGTDFPVIRPQRAIEEFEAMDLRPESLDALLGGNAARLYGLDA